MEWQLHNPCPRVSAWILCTPDGVRVARIAHEDGSWNWIAGIHNLGMVLYNGRERCLGSARDAATRAAQRIGHLARAAWTSSPGGRASLRLRDETLAIVSPSIYSDPRAARGWMDWCIPGTRIGGECFGLLNACVVASREAADYWSGPHSPAGDGAVPRGQSPEAGRRGADGGVGLLLPLPALR